MLGGGGDNRMIAHRTKIRLRVDVVLVDLDPRKQPAERNLSWHLPHRIQIKDVGFRI